MRPVLPTKGLVPTDSQTPMKRTSEKPLQPFTLPKQGTVTQDTVTLAEQYQHHSDSSLHALRLQALHAGNTNILSNLLAARPGLAFRLRMRDTTADMLQTLAAALPQQAPSPSIELIGPWPEGAKPRVLASFFTHPALHSLLLSGSLLTSVQLEAVVEATRQTPSALTAFTYHDDRECLTDPELVVLLGQLKALRQLDIGVATDDGEELAADDPRALALAGALLARPLDALVLREFGPFMAHLRRAWTRGHPPSWHALTLSSVCMDPEDSEALEHLAAVLSRCVKAPSIGRLSLKGFQVEHDGPDNPLAADVRHNLSMPVLENALAQAIRQRTHTLILRVTTDHLAAMHILMRGLSGQPTPADADPANTDAADAPANPGIGCVRELHLTYRPTPSELAGGAGGGSVVHRFLDGIAQWMPRLHRLDALAITLGQPGGDPETPAPPPLAAGGLTAVVDALASLRLTRLRVDGDLLTPMPDELQACLQRVRAQAADAELQMKALGGCFGFMAPPGYLPADVGRLIIQHVRHGDHRRTEGQSRDLLRMQGLDRATQAAFVSHHHSVIEAAAKAKAKAEAAAAAGADAEVMAMAGTPPDLPPSATAPTAPATPLGSTDAT